VQGAFNIEDTERPPENSSYYNNPSNRKYLNIVGNGVSDVERSNAHTLDWEGNAWFSGDVTATINGNNLSIGKLDNKITKLENGDFNNTISSYEYYQKQDKDYELNGDINIDKDAKIK
jgi:hypothetical protein